MIKLTQIKQLAINKHEIRIAKLYFVKILFAIAQNSANKPLQLLHNIG